MALLTPNSIPVTGLRIDNLFVAASGPGDTCVTGSDVKLIVKNASATPLTVTIAYPQPYDGDQTVPGRTFTVPITTGETVIPVRDIYKNTSTGLASITYSAVATITVCLTRG